MTIHQSFIFEGTNLLFIYIAVHSSAIVSIIIILKVNDYVFFSSLFLHLILVPDFKGKFHVIVWLLCWILPLS